MSSVLSSNNALNTPTAHTPADPPDSVASAIERLASSRQQLQIALAQTVESRRPRAPAVGHTAPAWLNELKAVPGVGILVQALSAWWAKYPLNAAGVMAFDAANALAKPLAARHPVPLILGAVLVGGLLVRSRPWRWILKPALLAGLMAQVSAKLVAQVPLQSWMSLLTAFAQGRAQAPVSSESSSARTKGP